MLKRSLFALLFLSLLSAAGLLTWLAIPYAVDRQSIESSLVSDPQVQVSQQRFQVFTPVNGQSVAGVIFYPGGKADPDSYAPVLKKLAGTGVTVVNVPMPLNMALLGQDKASEVMQSFPHIEHWYLAGHSIGGVAAAEYAASNAHRLNGLIFWASYPNLDLSDLALPVLSIFGSRDTSTTPGEVEERKSWLPRGAVFVQIDADHWEFGDFARSAASDEQLHSRAAVQRHVVEETRRFIAPDQ